jgi:uncharacterized protein YbjT (DUF2867 family)
MKVALTGATGFVGSHVLADLLLDSPRDTYRAPTGSPNGPCEKDE